MTVDKREECIWPEGVWAVEAAEVHTVAQEDLMIHTQSWKFQVGEGPGISEDKDKTRDRQTEYESA